jgi:hypothetical protein
MTQALCPDKVRSDGPGAGGSGPGIGCLKLLSVAVLFFAGAWTSPALDNGVDPYHLGKGDWLWQLDLCEQAIGAPGNLQALIDFEKNKGMQFLIIKACDCDSTWGQFNADLVTRCHQAGMKVFGFQYIYGVNSPPSWCTTGVQGEINAACRAMAVTDYSGVPMDGFVIDAEIEYNGQPANANAYCQGLRAQFPNRFIAHSPYPVPSWNVDFPYIEFGKYCDAAFPQDYWYDQMGTTPENMLQTMNDDFIYWQNIWRANGHADSVKPLIPIGQGFQGRSPVPIPGSELTRFYNLLKSISPCATAGGYQGISFWSCQHHTTDEWNAIAAMTFVPLPVITNQPVSLVRTQGNAATFSVLAGPAPLTYQWRKDGGNLSASTTDTLSLSNVTTNDTASYDVVAHNDAGSVTSAVATLTVLAPPYILDQPQSQGILEGQNATLALTARGTEVLGYRWQWNTTLYGPGTNRFITHNPGNYLCIVSNAAGAVTSDVATLIIIYKPQIVTPPQSQTNPPGTRVTLSVVPSGTEPLRYFWQYGGKIYPGTNTFATTKAGDYSAIVTNAAGSATSTVATLVFANPPPAQPGHFEGISRLSNGWVQLSMSGTACTNYALEYTGDWVGWTNLSTLSAPNGLFQYTDPCATNGGRRFYRLRL